MAIRLAGWVRVPVGIVGDVQEQGDGGLLGGHPRAGNSTHPVTLEGLVVGAHVLGAPDQRGPARPVDAGPGPGADGSHRPSELQGAPQRNIETRPAQNVDEADEVAVQGLLDDSRHGSGPAE